MKIKAVKKISTCITSGNEYEVLKEGKDLIVIGDDGYAIGLSKDNFEESKEKVLSPVEWLEQILKQHCGKDFTEGYKQLFDKAKEMESKLIEESYSRGFDDASPSGREFGSISIGEKYL